MSVIIDVTYKGETFEVEVFHDGHIEFPGRNLQHEQAMEEFTNSASGMVQFYDLWKKLPFMIIAQRFFGLNWHVRTKLKEDLFGRILLEIRNHHHYDINSVKHFREQDAWEIRRFVDAMEAIGQGLPWPPLEATP
jgi:hypothetical protein